MQGFLDRQEQLMACTVKHWNLLCTNGHVAVDVVIPYGNYWLTGNQTHASDAINQNLQKLRNRSDFLQLLLIEIHHTCVEEHSNITFLEQLMSSALTGAFHVLGCSSKSLK